ncbi:MAG TPA: hypothetical protein ENN73_00615, partial [Firmicutes bacterium]|nr:hypothetical protein [Bacillota bacterium]
FLKLLDAKTWLAAYGQVFFSFSIGFGIMIAYASFLPRKSDITNNAFIVGLTDAFTAFLAGFAVFSAIGFLSYRTGVRIDSISGGASLAFITFPIIIENMRFPVLFGILFFIMLLTLGIDSAFSLVESSSAGLMDKYHLPRKTVNAWIAVAGFILGLIFTTRSGVHWLSITDYFLSNYGLVIVGLLECIIIGWVFGSGKLRRYVNSVSEMKIGIWWDIFIRFFTPVFLLISLTITTIQIFTDVEKTDLKGYTPLPIFLGGVLVLLVFLAASIILGWKHQKLSLEEEEDFNLIYGEIKEADKDFEKPNILLDIIILFAMLFGVGLLTLLLLLFLPGWLAMLIVGIVFFAGGLTFCLMRYKKTGKEEFINGEVETD